MFSLNEDIVGITGSESIHSCESTLYNFLLIVARLSSGDHLSGTGELALELHDGHSVFSVQL